MIHHFGLSKGSKAVSGLLWEGSEGRVKEGREESMNGVPSFAYSSTVFFSPTLKPSVLEATRSSSPWDAMINNW